MAIEYWPFLVAANEQLDYRVVLCPDFIEECGRAHVLRTNVGDVQDDEYEGKLRFVQVQDKQLGSFGIFFKEVTARINGALAVDLAGRHIRRITGLVVRGIVDRQQFKSVQADKLLDETELEFQIHFEEFWNAGASAKVKISACRADGYNKAAGPILNQTDISPVLPSHPGASPASNARPTNPPDKMTVSNSTRSIAYTFFALGLALFAAAAYEHFSLKQQMHRAMSQMVEAYQPLWGAPLKSRIEAVESRLSVLENSKSNATSNSKSDTVVQDH